MIHELKLFIGEKLLYWALCSLPECDLKIKLSCFILENFKQINK